MVKITTKVNADYLINLGDHSKSTGNQDMFIDIAADWVRVIYEKV